MNTAARLSAYGVSLALVAVGGWVVGAAVGPFAGEAGVRGGEDAAHGDVHSGTVAGATRHLPEGLASSRGGYTLTPTSTTLASGEENTFAFRIGGPDGEAVTRFDVEHAKRMHLILVRRDASHFQHVHPVMSDDGTWSVPITVGEAGSYRAFADFTPAGGESMTLGVDLAVPGDFQPVHHEPSRVAHVDGYEVRLDGELVPGRTSSVTTSISKDGRPVTDLEPYLGADGHLVALREGDLAYLHVHPGGHGETPEETSEGDIGFAAEVPSAGTYRLFLDFRHEGTVRTAEFTVNTQGAPGTGHGHGR
ncbi:hypothetical protein [Saccharomonospora cyanea]|uniref:Secreted protein n=1 Tax=Saccharomonospora cyanea NA-134 TaxID=882082 RepID=H5XJ91_9PSEU|nr:hypothetical protein [Saccharomonospora cyanea]EHR62901.1 hypothetical protein SaccyDRAFT_4080 [Saccharomonospora cyanea NA-134]